MNSIQSLLFRPFSSLNLEEKNEVKRLGRPTPNLKITQAVKTKTRSFNRNFNSDVYDKYDWMCGCDVNNVLFCFPCLLFGGEDPWTKHGVSDLQHLHDRAKKHVASKLHMKNVVKLVMFGNVNIAQKMDSAYRRAVEEHNQKVAQNRYVLNIIINCIRFCGAFELALRGHDESDTSNNPGIFRGLINFSSELDSVEEKKLHTELSTIYSTEEFRNISGAVSLMEFFRDNNLCSTFSESVKLLNVIITIPMTTCEAERSFSTLKRIKTFLRNTMSEERLCALAMLSIERDFILKMRDFNERVIEKFVTGKERRVDFLYK